MEVRCKRFERLETSDVITTEVLPATNLYFFQQ